MQNFLDLLSQVWDASARLLGNPAIHGLIAAAVLIVTVVQLIHHLRD